MNVTQVLLFWHSKFTKEELILKLHFHSIPYQVVSQFQKSITRGSSKSSKRLNQVKNTIFKFYWIKEHPLRSTKPISKESQIICWLMSGKRFQQGLTLRMWTEPGKKRCPTLERPQWQRKWSVLKAAGKYMKVEIA